jgi:hypothetical protein
MTRRNQTKPDGKTDAAEAQEAALYCLTPAQETALQALLSGATITEAAATAGVQRQTVSGWLNHDSTFIAAYNRRRQFIADEFEGQLRALGRKALKTIETALDGDAALDAAKTILRAVTALSRPAGPVTPGDVEGEQRSKTLMSLLKSL